MLFDYTRYTLDELYQAWESIDKERFPDRAEQLKHEIITREQKLGVSVDSKKIHRPAVPVDDDDDDETDNFFIEFDPHNSFARIFFVLAVSVTAVFGVSQTLPLYWSADIVDTLQFATQPQRVVCNRSEYYEDGVEYKEYELKLNFAGDNFYAWGISRQQCTTLAAIPADEFNASVRVINEKIYELTVNGEVRLSFEQMNRIYQRDISEQRWTYSIFFLVFIGFVAKSFINAVRPGTFVKT